MRLTRDQPTTGPEARRQPARGPAQPGERAIAPDLARGLMLLLIVVSNTMFFLWAATYDGASQHPVARGLPDAIAQFLMIVTLDMRIYPLFAFLFGYGMMQVFLRQTAAGTSETGAVRLLRRRSLWLLLFGFLHAALLLPTDVLGAYGVISLVLGWLFLRRSGRALLTWSTVGAVLLGLQLVVGTAVTFAIATGGIPAYDAGGTDPSELGTAALTGAGETNYLIAIVARLANWSVISALTVFGITAPVAMLLGFWAARRRVLEEPHRHLGLLRRVAPIGIAIGWLGSLPAALAQVDALDLSSAPGLSEAGLLGMQWPTGLAGGVGYVALFALIAHWIGRRGTPPMPVVAVTAVGKRSLSCYLTHSLIMAPVLAAWGLGLGGQLSSATMVLFAFGVWLVTVAGAYALERTGLRGPAEVVLRRLMYGRRET